MDRRGDYHIHTHYLGCGNATMTLPDIVARCAKLGLTELAITDHLNDLKFLDKHRRIRAELETLDCPIPVYFGAELNFVAMDGDFAYGREVAQDLGFQFAIGGIHTTYLKEYDLTKLIDIQHRHHLATCRHPLVEVLVHPWWFPKGEFTRNGFPWFDDMSVVPRDLTRELGRVARETGTAIEINACAMFLNPAYSFRFKHQYIDYLVTLAAEGATFALGSDAHDICQLRGLELAEAAAREAGLTPDRLWHPEGKAFRGGAAG